MFNIKAVNQKNKVTFSITGRWYEVHRGESSAHISVEGYSKLIIIDCAEEEPYPLFDVAYITLDGETVDTVHPPLRESRRDGGAICQGDEPQSIKEAARAREKANKVI